MKYRCAIYNYDHASTAPMPGMSTSPHVPACLVAIVTVSAPSPRQAAARAYVRRVGRRRARLFQEMFPGPKSFAQRESNPQAVARKLRLTANWIGDCWQLDNPAEAWFIRVEPRNARPHPLHRPRPSPPLLHQLRYPPPN
jgi:hypothetical protein